MTNCKNRSNEETMREHCKNLCIVEKEKRGYQNMSGMALVELMMT